MRVLVYVHRKHQGAASERVAALRAEGHRAFYRDARGFDGDTEACDLVLSDEPAVAAAYQARGVDVAPFTEPEPEPDTPRPARRGRKST